MKNPGGLAASGVKFVVSGLRRRCLFAVGEQAQQHQEEVDEVHVEPEGAEDGLLARGLAVIACVS